MVKSKESRTFALEIRNKDNGNNKEEKNYIKQKCHKSFYLGKSDSGTWGIYGECPLIPKNINYDKITVKIS